jgi:hypothetical protein
MLQTCKHIYEEAKPVFEAYQVKWAASMSVRLLIRDIKKFGAALCSITTCLSHNEQNYPVVDVREDIQLWYTSIGGHGKAHKLLQTPAASAPSQ